MTKSSWAKAEGEFGTSLRAGAPSDHNNSYPLSIKLITHELFTNVGQKDAFAVTNPVATEPEPTGSQTKSELVIQSSFYSQPTNRKRVWGHDEFNALSPGGTHAKRDKTEISILSYKGRGCLPAAQTARCWQLLGKHRLSIPGP